MVYNRIGMTIFALQIGKEYEQRKYQTTHP